MKGEPLRALLVEDSHDDARLIVETLRLEGFAVTWERVETGPEIETVLTQSEFDVVLADYRLPHYCGLEVLEVLRRRELDLPVIIVSGTIGEEAAAEAMRAGAKDFVMKERLTRLAPVIRREMAEAVMRRERRSAEADLRLEQHRFRALVERSAEVISVVDQEGILTYGTPSLSRVLGYSISEYIGNSMFEFVHPDDIPPVREAFAQLTATPGSSERRTLRLRHKTGRWLWMDTTAMNLLDDVSVRGVVVNYRDVTARRFAEEALEDSEELYRTTFDEAPIGIAHASPDGRFLRVNREFARLLGYGPPELLQLGVPDITLPEEREQDMATMQQLLAGALRTHSREKRFLCKDGSMVWTVRTVSLRRDAEGRPVHFIAILEDITQRKEAELALREVQERYQAILDHSPALIYLKDIQGRFILTNRVFVEKFVPAGKNAIGSKAHDLFTSRVADLDEAHDRAAFASATPVTQEITIYERDGAHVYISTKFLLRNGSGQPYAVGGIATDVSDRKKIEQQFLQAQKMEAFGQLAGGVAHDFNNILAVQLMHFNLLGADPDLGAKAKSILKELEAAANRASSLVRQLLIFSRRHEIIPQVLDLNHTIESTCKMLKRFVGENIEFSFEPAPAPLWAEADPGMLEQVVLNLCVNARDAMPHGGRLTVALRVVRQRNPEVDAAIEGDYGCILVSDTGHGMDEATKKRIFEPFFTTKPVGRGTGLGLATVHGIAEQHHGWIEVESEPHAGSTFRVYLPCRDGPAGAEPPADEKLLTGSGRILLAEDEESVRVAATACLRRAGYEVTEAPDGIQAMMRWDEAHGEFDLLLTDMVMPGGLTGFQVAEFLLRAKPSLKVILMTGYSPGATNWSAPVAEQIVRMTKPFSAVKLLQAVHDALANLGKPAA